MSILTELSEQRIKETFHFISDTVVLLVSGFLSSSPLRSFVSTSFLEKFASDLVGHTSVEQQISQDFEAPIALGVVKSTFGIDFGVEQCQRESIDSTIDEREPTTIFTQGVK